MSKFDEDAVCEYYAGFGRRTMSDGAIWCLALASDCLPDRHPGFKLWITQVAGIERNIPELQEWARGVADTIAKMKPKRIRSVTYVNKYDPRWGNQAAIDGLKLALFGEEDLTSANVRAQGFGCDRRDYKKIRNFVAGAALQSIYQYQNALLWAHRIARQQRVSLH